MHGPFADSRSKAIATHKTPQSDEFFCGSTPTVLIVSCDKEQTVSQAMVLMVVLGMLRNSVCMVS